MIDKHEPQTDWKYSMAACRFPCRLQGCRIPTRTAMTREAIVLAGLEMCCSGHGFKDDDILMREAEPAVARLRW